MLRVLHLAETAQGDRLSFPMQHLQVAIPLGKIRAAGHPPIPVTEPGAARAGGGEVKEYKGGVPAHEPA